MVFDSLLIVSGPSVVYEISNNKGDCWGISNLSLELAEMPLIVQQLVSSYQEHFHMLWCWALYRPPYGRCSPEEPTRANNARNATKHRVIGD